RILPGALLRDLNSNITSDACRLRLTALTCSSAMMQSFPLPMRSPNGHSFGLRCRSRCTEISAYQAVAPSKKMTGARPGTGQTAGCHWPTDADRAGPADG